MAFWFTQREKLDEINVPALIALLPNGARYRAEGRQVRYARAIIRQLPTLVSQFQINTPLRLAHFLAQGLVESGYLRSTEENLVYSDAARIRHAFRYAFDTDEEAIPFVGRYKDLANRTYSSKNGNGPPSSGDGWRYRGSGFIQLTFRNNYRAAGELIGINIERDPNRVRRDYDVAVLAGAAFFLMNRLHQFADENQARKLSRAVNRGSANASAPAHAEDERVALTDRVLSLIEDPRAFMTAIGSRPVEAIGLRSGDSGEDVRELQTKLNRLGQVSYQTGYPDGIFGQATKTAVAAFQDAHGLPSDGIAGPATLEALDDALSNPAEGPTPERRQATPSDMADRGVRQAQDAARVSSTGSAVGAAGLGVLGHEVMDSMGPGEDASSLEVAGSLASQPEGGPSSNELSEEQMVEPTLPELEGDSLFAEPAAEEVVANDSIVLPEAGAEVPSGSEELALPPTSNAVPQELPATSDAVFVARTVDLEFDWPMLGLGLFLIVAALFIVFRGRRISRDTEDGYRTGRIS